MHPRTIERWLGSGELIRAFHGVYALRYERRDPRSVAQAALLAAGELSALARETAAALWAVTDRWPAAPQLLGVGRVNKSAIDYRRTTTLLVRDVTTIDGLRVTSAARTILDIAALLQRKRLERAIDGLRVRRLLSTDQLVDIAARNVQHPGAAMLRAQLGLAQKEPTRSELERTFLKLTKKYGLPVPEINVHVGGYRVDAYYQRHRLIVELDGWATHQTRAAFERDRRQDADILALTGIPTVRFTYDRTLYHAAETAQQLSRILDSRP